MEESENLRKETNQIVQKLREEFDSLVKDFMNYKKNDSNKGRNADKKTSKSYVPDIGVQKVPDLDKGLIESANAARRIDQNTNDPSFMKRGNRGIHEDEKMDVDKEHPGANR